MKSRLTNPILAHGACGAGADAEPAARRPFLPSHQKKNEQNDEDQSEATNWIIFDFSEEEAMARCSA